MDQIDSPAHRYGIRGFDPQDPRLADQLKALTKVSTAFGIGACLLDWAIMLAAALGSWILFMNVGVTVVSVLAYALAAFVIASRLQGLRNLIHEASHYNLSRNRRLNDLLCRVATFPIQPFLDMAEQRRVHVRSHHGQFLNPDDNVFVGYRNLGIDILPLDSRRAGLVVLTKGLIKYCVWHVAGAFSLSLLKKKDVPLWGGAAVGFVILLVLFPQPVLLCVLAILLYWTVPTLFILPPLSFSVLIAEHLSTVGHTEFERSRNKLGLFQRVFFHPHGDAYHLLHHLYPNIPHNRLGKAHRLLMGDPVYRNGKHCHGLFFGRRSVLRAILDKPTS